MIFLSIRFYVKLILEVLEVLKMLFLPFLDSSEFGEFDNVQISKSAKIDKSQN